MDVNNEGDATHREDYLASAGVRGRQMPKRVERGLLNLYFRFVNSMVPLVHRERFMAAHAKGTASELLTKTICLVALGLEPAAAVVKFGSGGRLSRLEQDSPMESVGHTASLVSRQTVDSNINLLAVALYGAVSAALRVNYHDGDDIVRVQVLALMSLRIPVFRDTTEETWRLCQAITVAQSIGLHSMRTGKSATTQRSNESNEGSDLWWSLFVLDRLGTMSQEHKLDMICDRDIGIKRPLPGDTILTNSTYKELCEWLDFVCPRPQEEHSPVRRTDPASCAHRSRDAYVARDDPLGAETQGKYRQASLCHVAPC